MEKKQKKGMTKADLDRVSGGVSGIVIGGTRCLKGGLNKCYEIKDGEKCDTILYDCTFETASW